MCRVNACTFAHMKKRTNASTAQDIEHKKTNKLANACRIVSRRVPEPFNGKDDSQHALQNRKETSRCSSDESGINNQQQADKLGVKIKWFRAFRPIIAPSNTSLTRWTSRETHDAVFVLIACVLEFASATSTACSTTRAAANTSRT